MSPTPPATDPPATVAEIVVAERWADYTKAFAIYPEANQRVAEILRALLDQVGHLGLSRGEPGAAAVRILFPRGAVRAGGERIEVRPGSNLAWLKERIDRAALAGVEFLPDLDEEAIEAFTRRLLEVAHGRDRRQRFEDLWPQPFRGMRLLDRRFIGTFSEEGSGEETVSWGAGTHAELDLRDEADLLAVLERDGAIVERLQRIQDGFARHGTAGGEDTRRVDLLGRIVRLLPADPMPDLERVREVAAQVLDRVERALEEGTISGESAGERAPDRMLNALLFVTSRTAFARDGPSARALAERLQQEIPAATVADEVVVRPGDEAFADDREALFAEARALPQRPAERVERPDDPIETLGVHLWFLTHLPQDAAAARARPVLDALLAEMGPREVEVLRRYLESDEPGLRRDRLHALLREAGLLPVLRQHGLFTPLEMLQRFPTDFLPYLDCLDLGRHTDRAELADLLDAMGAERVRAAGPRLVADGLVARERAAPLLSWPTRAFAPLVAVLLDQDSATWHDDVVAWLRRCNSTAREACLLLLGAETPDLPDDYLLGLLDPPREPSEERRFRNRVASLLCDFVRRAGHASARRVFAIRFLAEFQTEEARRLLQELARPARFPFPRSSVRALREAATRALRAYGTASPSV